VARRLEDPSTTTLPKLQKHLYCTYTIPLLSLVVAEIHLIENRIRELCEKAATVNDSGVPALFAELQPCCQNLETSQPRTLRHLRLLTKVKPRSANQVSSL